MGNATYKQLWVKRKLASLPRIQCACGCGDEIPSETLDGTPRRFQLGHQGRGVKRTNRPWNYKGTRAEHIRRANAMRAAKRAAMEKIPCCCGCGTRIPAITSTGQPARYLLGHNRGGEKTWFQRGVAPWNKGKPHPTKRQGNRTSFAVGGWRDDLGQYFRSRWEANFARYLKTTGRTYVYEPGCYVVTIDDGTTHAYRPDFLIDETAFVELKGWIGRKPYAAAVLRAAAVQLPYPLTVIYLADYQRLEGEIASTIPSWEYRNSRLKPLEPRTCVGCKVMFTPPHPRRRYCSDGCAGSFKNRKLSDDEVRQIRSLASTGVPRRQLGLQFSVTKATIKDIVLRRTWKHL